MVLPHFLLLVRKNIDCNAATIGCVIAMQAMTQAVISYTAKIACYRQRGVVFHCVKLSHVKFHLLMLLPNNNVRTSLRQALFSATTRKNVASSYFI